MLRSRLGNSMVRREMFLTKGPPQINQHGQIEDRQQLCRSKKEGERTKRKEPLQPMGLLFTSTHSFLYFRTLPESFLREDDVYYETIKAFVEKGFGTCNFERVYHVDQDNIQMFNLPNDLRNLLSMLDDMTNNGLQLLAEILTGGSIKFGKTRWKMKKFIKECLPEILGHLKVAKEEHISYEKEVHGSVIAQVLEELLPQFPESGKERVKELMGLK